MKFCPECGCENIDEAQFCRNCGLEFNVEIEKKSQKPPKANNSIDASGLSSNPVISNLFLKEDKYTGELRIGKAKTISIAIFILMFLFAMTVGVEGASLFALILTAIIFGLIFAVPTFVIGYVIGIVIDRMSN